ncbi:MAG: hypothetical protein QW714_01835 [Nanopusillaceae archaeon]
MVFKQYARKIRYAKLLSSNKYPSIWVIIRKFGRIVSPLRMKIKRHWRRKKVSL